MAHRFVIRHHRPPPKPPRLADIIAIIASFGGYLARKSDPPPGPKAIWIGLQRLRDFVIARTAMDEINRTCVKGCGHSRQRAQSYPRSPVLPAPALSRCQPSAGAAV